VPAIGEGGRAGNGTEPHALLLRRCKELVVSAAESNEGSKGKGAASLAAFATEAPLIWSTKGSPLAAAPAQCHRIEEPCSVGVLPLLHLVVLRCREEGAAEFSMARTRGRLDAILPSSKTRQRILLPVRSKRYRG
jgi:hypothetical protein